MYCWLCWHHEWESSEVCKIFDSEEKAKDWFKDATFWLSLGANPGTKADSLGIRHPREGTPDSNGTHFEIQKRLIE
jgi:hypothetical protein